MARTRRIPNPPAEQVEVKRRSKAIYIEFKMVKLATLKIPDEVYQRPSSTRAVNRMVEEGWDDGLQSVLLISAETDNVLDGAHRVRAARRLGIVQLPALVYHGLTLQEEARYFAEFNRKRLPVGLRARHRAAQIYGDPAHIDAEKVIVALNPKEVPLQTVMAANARYPGVLMNLVPVMKQMHVQAFSRDFIAGMVHYGNAWGGFLPEETKERLLEPGMYRSIVEAIKQVMREHMAAGDRAALPTDWSVRGEGVELALTTKQIRAPLHSHETKLESRVSC